MGIITLSNHLSLIRDCYPTKTLTTTPLADLKPDSNALSKLCFYSSGRPKKLPKVAAAVLERADRDARTVGSAKARAGLAVTVDITRGLVSECRGDLQCFAEQALAVAERALGRREAGKRDTVLEAKGAALFHAVSVYSSGPSIGLDQAVVKQYLRCLSILSSMAQLGPDQATSRWIALSALDGAVTSELLYSAASDYTSQIRLIVPALLYNCIDLPVEQLRKNSNVSDAAAHTSNLGLVPDRKSSPIIPPSSPPPPADLASQAVHCLRTTVRLSHASQLSAKLTATVDWLDQHAEGVLWEREDLVEWIGAFGVAATAVQYRAGVVTWWVDQVAEIDGSDATPKHKTLVEVLSSILRGPTSLVGLGIGTILAQLTQLLIKRVPLGDDPLAPRLLEAISGLASHVYYFDQLNDVIADLIETIRSVRSGGAGSSAREEDRACSVRVLVSALRGVLEEAQKGNSQVQAAVPLSVSKSNGTVKANGDANGNSNGGANGSSGELHRPPLPVGDGTVRGNGVLVGSGQGIRSKKETTEPALDAMGRPIMRVANTGRRNRISADVLKESLFLLTEPDPVVRFDYQATLLLYVAEEMDVSVGVDGKDDRRGDPSSDSARFFDELHAAIYEAATSFVAAPSKPDRPASPIIIRTLPRERERTKSMPRKPSRSRQSSYTSLRRPPSPPRVAPVATAADYAGLLAIIAAAQSRASSPALLTAVPMLLALERDVTEHIEANFSPEGSSVKVQACRELVAGGLVAVGAAWDVSEIERVAGSALAALKPSVLPKPPVKVNSPFAAEACNIPPPLDDTEIIHFLSGSQRLQAASGLDRSTLASTLGCTWTADTARFKAQLPNLYHSELARSMTNLSAFRISRTPDRAPSFRTPSLADLQTSLGRSGSVHTSATPSIASTSGTVATFDTRRRTNRTGANLVLEGLTIGGRESRLSVASRAGGGTLAALAQNASRFITA